MFCKLKQQKQKQCKCWVAGVVTHHHRRVHINHAYNDKLLELSRTAFQGVCRGSAEDVIACTTTVQQRLLSSFGQPPSILCEPLNSPHKCHQCQIPSNSCAWFSNKHYPQVSGQDISSAGLAQISLSA